MSDIEFILLSLLAELKGATGYQINRLVEERGYRAWARLGSTSIYTGLKRLEKSKLVIATADVKKSGRGPQGRRFRLTSAGRRSFQEALWLGLTKTREHDVRFNVALAALDVLPADKAMQAFEERAEFLREERIRLKKVFGAQRNDLSDGGVLLFERILNSISAEIRWLKAVHTDKRANAERP